MTKQLRKVFSILCAIVLLISSLSMALAEETVPAADDAARIAAEEAAARKAEEEAARKAAEEAARKKAEEEAARKAAEEEAARKKAEEEAARKAAEEEAARKAAEEEAARKAAEEEAARKAAEEEAARKAAEEEAARIAAEQQAAEAQAAAEQPAAEQPSDEVPAEEESDDGTVEIDDDWGSIDPEVISENTPEITDELKGLRTAELSVGQSISDTIDFGEQLTVTLKKSDADGVILKLYTNASINTTVDGKAAGFTPADSDDPSRKLYVCELANAGRSHEIVLTADDTASFKLAAVAKQAAGTQEEAPADNGNGTSSDSGKPAANKPDATPAPTVQASVKTYDALKVGSRISDSLIVGQKAKIQVKCGKNPFVTLTLKASPDDVKVSVDGGDVRFTSADNGTYIAELENVAFRKFTVVISSRKEISFTLSAEANKAAAEAAEEAEEEPAVEEAVKNNKEETEQPAEEPAAEEKAEEAAETEASNKEETEEPAAGEDADQTEVPEDENSEETEQPAEEATEEEEASEEENGEETEQPAEEATEEEEASEEENGEETEQPDEETTEEDEASEEENSEETVIYEEKAIEYKLKWDDESPDIGSTAHLKAVIPSDITDEPILQWQNSVDGVNFTDIEGATGKTFDVVVTLDNYKLYWRVVMKVPVPAETEE